MPLPTTPEPSYVGTLEPLPQGSTLTLDQQRGGTIVEHYRGFSLDQLKARIASYNGSFQRATLEDRFGIGDLRLEWASDSNGNIASPGALSATRDRWEVSEPTEQKDIFTHPYFVWLMRSAAGSDNATADCISIVRRKANDAQTAAGDGPTTLSSQTIANVIAALSVYLTSIGQGYPGDTPSFTFSDWLWFYKLYANNQTHYQETTYALRHTTNAPAYWTRNVADANINSILTQAQFLSEIQDATLWANICSPRLVTKLSTAYSEFVADRYERTRYAFGWLKSPSAEADVGAGRIEIQTVYKLDQWLTAVYPLAV